MVIWIIGLSGAGKTTLAEEVTKRASLLGKTVVHLDGDTVREVMGNDLGHSIKDRLKNAERICRLCALLDKHKINVVCSILSLFPETREWCRINLRSYYEVFIDTPIEQLQERDSKGIYSRFMAGEISEVAGLDLDFPVPLTPDLVIHNDAQINDLLKHSDQLASLLN